MVKRQSLTMSATALNREGRNLPQMSYVTTNPASGIYGGLILLETRAFLFIMIFILAGNSRPPGGKHGYNYVSFPRRTLSQPV